MLYLNPNIIIITIIITFMCPLRPAQVLDIRREQTCSMCVL